MKKAIFIAAASVITILSACILVRTNVRNDEDFFTANVEALAQDPENELTEKCGGCGTNGEYYCCTLVIVGLPGSWDLYRTERKDQ